MQIYKRYKIKAVKLVEVIVDVTAANESDAVEYVKDNLLIFNDSKNIGFELYSDYADKNAEYAEKASRIINTDVSDLDTAADKKHDPVNVTIKDQSDFSIWRA